MEDWTEPRMRDVLGGTTSRAEAAPGRRPLGRLGHAVRVLGLPQLFVLLPPEALVVVALHLEQLLKVRFAVEFALEGGEGANAAENNRRKGDRSGGSRAEGEEEPGSYLSLALQCLQQKQLEWKTESLATNLSIG